MPEHNSRGYHHGDRIDKGIMPVEHFHPARNDIFAAHVCGGPPMNADPHGAGPRDVVHVPVDSRRPVGEPAAMTPPHDPAPHPPNPSASHKLPNTYGKVPHR
jgi:hypothetical protein